MPDNWSEIAGFVASFLVFLTFSMRTIVSLRVVAILSNVTFIIYSASSHLVPILILHSALLPMNLFRTYQHLRLFRRIRQAAQGPAEARDLLPFMRHEPAAVGTELFRKGDPAEKMYFLSKGSIRLPEIDKVLGAGELFGEVALFSSNGRRTTSAVCLDDCELYVIGRDKLHELYLRDSAFGFFVTKLIASRLDDNLSRMVVAGADRSGGMQQNPDTSGARPNIAG